MFFVPLVSSSAHLGAILREWKRDGFGFRKVFTTANILERIIGGEDNSFEQTGGVVTSEDNTLLAGCFWHDYNTRLAFQLK